MKHNYDYIYIFSGKRNDIWQLVSMLLLTPLVASIFVFYLTGKQLNTPATFFCVDAVVILYWGIRAWQRRKEQISMENEDRMEEIYKKLEELR